MNRFPILATTVALSHLAAAALMQSGQWCYLCHDQARKDCKAGTCQVVEYDTFVDHDAFLHDPQVDFGGGGGD